MKKIRRGCFGGVCVRCTMTILVEGVTTPDHWGGGGIVRGGVLRGSRKRGFDKNFCRTSRHHCRGVRFLAVPFGWCNNKLLPRAKGQWRCSATPP